MGTIVCKKCGIRKDSTLIIDNTYRRHCRIHNFASKNGNTFFCKDCRCHSSAKHNCRHVYTFKLCCFVNN